MAVNEATSKAKPDGRRHHGDVEGKTMIADSVVASIAGIATREASGVYAMGGGISRTLGAARNKMSGSDDVTRGVRVEVGEKQAAVDLDVVVEYGYPITRTTDDIRSGVADAVETMTGLEVAEVNIDVLDVHLEGSDDDGDDEPRAR
ncbi:Asp23/Gls24 family envelope stress response protein [Streptomyces sp. NBC_01498]|uniref:Asp23/Gls24 family envelope stress response protein n=1 Tax=Streptomyces sp. NBC_01498 TaxID=2975870 RepID=UPI002E7AB270|nr:Asp23/Gls24 family envelope stress response protein [Streptomyces sp. NBC_01498]WTL27674.1 Asp23/Gls24 family envelope stress response protein [Streptomyces sp. NBC_01498]